MSSRDPQPELKFFFDNNIAKQIARGVAEFGKAQGIHVVHLTDKFKESALDVEWIPSLRHEGGWIIISADVRISKNLAERAAWRESGLTAFFFEESFSQKRFWAQSAEITRWFQIIIDTARTCPPGCGFKLPSKGKDPKRIFTPDD